MAFFTSVLRQVVSDKRSETNRIHWIVFDGDVDPEWAENLNSVLDDNKILTLPNGERLSIPPNVRIMFEVDTLKYATLATVSRCGIVWFSPETVTYSMTISKKIHDLMHRKLNTEPSFTMSTENSPVLVNQRCVSIIEPLCGR